AARTRRIRAPSPAPRTCASSTSGIRRCTPRVSESAEEGAGALEGELETERSGGERRRRRRARDRRRAADDRLDGEAVVIVERHALPIAPAAEPRVARRADGDQDQPGDDERDADDVEDRGADRVVVIVRMAERIVGAEAPGAARAVPQRDRDGDEDDAERQQD